MPTTALFIELSRAADGLIDKSEVLLIGTVKKFGGLLAGEPDGSAQAAFAGPADAFACAVALLRRIAEHNDSCEPALKVRLRQAIHKGPLSFEADRVTGEPAQLLPRLLAVTPPGRILATRAACAPVLGAPDWEFIPLGWEYFDGLRQPVDIFEVVTAPGKDTDGR
ncbi:MAG: hypothetical protein HY059_10080 [Proteobacteria bacterium]|nr:hypothetical protein [Pseudomonadota bacterium]